MGKGEIVCYVQFHLFPQCFQKACFPGASKGVIVWEWVKILINECIDTLYDKNSVTRSLFCSENNKGSDQKLHDACLIKVTSLEILQLYRLHVTRDS